MGSMIKPGRSRSYDAIAALAVTGGKPIQLLGYSTFAATGIPTGRDRCLQPVSGPPTDVSDSG